MSIQRPTDISKFFIAGINYKKTDAAIRGLYAISNEKYLAVLADAPAYGIKELFVLSTCNRTEIYGFAESASDLCELLCNYTEGSLAHFLEMAYIKQGEAAIEHLFNVAAGLDSQILGDYEIVGQIKQVVKFSKENNCIGAYMERLINSILQSSKEIKTNTSLSGGTVSVSFAAIQYINENITALADKKILLLGTGKIGRNTCKNMVDYLDTKNITLINRTEEKAAKLAKELDLQFAPANEMEQQVDASDIILVATNSDKPVILSSQLVNKGEKLIIDFSVPCNVEASAQNLPGITLVNVDELSKIKDETLHNREAEVPKAKAIIAKHIAEFIDWHNMRRHVPVLKEVKTKLEQLHNNNLYISFTTNSSPVNKGKENKIQKVINGMAVKMRQQNQQGCYYIEAINEYIAAELN
jgi:glutamyl-tRNA reductase